MGRQMEKGRFAARRVDLVMKVSTDVWITLINGLVAIVTVIWQGKKTRKEVRKNDVDDGTNTEKLTVGK